MTIKQETINKLYSLIVLVNENIQEKVEDAIVRLENSDDPDDHKRAQELKILNNQMTAMSDDSRTKYPHLFDDTQ